jgi:uncharacterized membrane protein
MLKTITFTTMHISIAFTVVYLMTGSVMVGGAVALVEPLCNSVGYFFHERIWERLKGSPGHSVQRRAELVPRVGEVSVAANA